MTFTADPTGSFWQDKAAVITGAAGGMGALETARILQAGGTVFAVDVLTAGHEGWERLKAAAGEDGPRLIPHTADISRPEAWSDLKEVIMARAPRSTGWLTTPASPCGKPLPKLSRKNGTASSAST